MAGIMTPRLARVLHAQYANYVKDPHPNFLVTIDPDDMRVWYFLIVGLDKPWRGGEYIFKLTAPDDFPQKPPVFEFLTKNGLFEPGGRICISIGEFHADDKPGATGSHGWRQTLGMKGFAVQVVNAMICFSDQESGVRIVNQPESMKILHAQNSRKQNSTDWPRIMKGFNEFILQNPLAEPVVNLRRGRGEMVSVVPSLSTSTTTAPPVAAAAAVKPPVAAAAAVKPPVAATAAVKPPMAAAAAVKPSEPAVSSAEMDEFISGLLE